MEQTTPRKSRKGIYLIAALVLVAIIIAFALISGRANQPVQGAKTIVVTIVNGDVTVEKTIQTEAEFLRGALDQENLIEGIEQQYGLYVLSVNGITADESLQQWWCFTKGGETLNTGVESTPIADGDAFEATLMTGW